MKAKQLIDELQDLIEKYGNKEVTYTAEWGRCDVVIVKPYDKTGNGPLDEEFKGVTRFHMH